MAPTIRAVSSVASGTTGSYSCPRPTGTTAGDLLVAFQVADYGSIGQLTAPSGWELVDQASATSDQVGVLYVKLWTKTATASEPASYAFGQDSDADGGVVIVALSDAALGAHDKSVSTTSGSSVTTPSVTAIAGDIELRFAAGSPDPGGSRSWTPPAGTTEHADRQSGIYATFTLATRTISTSGATGALNFTASGGLAPRQGWTVVVTTSSVPADIEVDGPVEIDAEVPAAAISAGGTSHPGTLALGAEVPAHALSAGQSPRAEGVWPELVVHDPTVAAGTVTLAGAPALTLAASVPGPDLRIGQSVTPDAVRPAITFFAPAIDAQQQQQIPAPAARPAVIVPPSVISVPVLPGDRITQDGQIEWAGFLMGAGTAYKIIELQGWRDLPPIDPGNVPRPTGHGSFPGRPQAAERIINLALQIRAHPDDFERLVEDLENVGGISDTEDELPIVARFGGTAYLVYGQLRARTPGPINRHYGLGLTQNAAIQWACSDPRRYSLIRHGVTIDVDDPTEIINQGNTSTQPEIRIHGPVTNPSLEIGETGYTIAFTLTVENNSRLDIDVKSGTAVIGQTSVTGTLTGSVPLTDWVLRPGINTIVYTASSGGTGGIDVFWRDAWT